MAEEKEIRYCPNCGEIVDNRFCPVCGQENKEYNHSFQEMSREFISHTFNLDSRFFRTIKFLLFMPGRLTSEYFLGRRETYISPFKLYLVISMLYFLTFTIQYFFHDIKQGVELVGSSIEAEKADSLVTIPLEKPAEKSAIEIFSNDIQIDQNEVISAFTESFPRIMFFLLPLAALILKILYNRKKFLYYQHLIFLIHIHTFFFLTMIINRIISYDDVQITILICTVAYLYIAAKIFYQQSALKTIFKMLFFSSTYLFLLVFLSLINLIISIFAII
jgi:hypothetical protein